MGHETAIATGSVAFKGGEEVIPISLFLYNEFYLPFVTIPAGVIISIGLKSPIPIVVFSMFTVLFFYLARLVSLLLGVSFVKTNTNRKTKRLYLGQLFQVAIFVVFILAIEVVTIPHFRASFGYLITCIISYR